MPPTESHELDGVTVGTGELSVLSGTTTLQTDTTPGIYQAWFDLGNIAKGDYFAFRIYEKVKAAGTKRMLAEWVNPPIAQSQIYVTPPLMLMHGWDVTIQKIAGTDRAFDASIRKVGTPTEFDVMSAVTISSTEISALSGTSSLATETTAGTYQVLVDANNMAMSDEFRLRVYEKVEATGGTKKLVHELTLWGAQPDIGLTPPLMLMNGWDVTLQKASGTDRAFDVSVRVAA